MISKSRFESFVLNYSIALILSIGLIQIATHTLRIGGDPTLSILVPLMLLALGALSSVVTAWYLYSFERRNKPGCYAWCLFGLCANLLAVVIYLLVCSYEQRGDS